MTTIARLAALLVPALLIIVYLRAPKNRARRRRIWLSFALGALSVAPLVCVASLSFGVKVADPLASAFLSSLTTAAIPEELFTLSILWCYSTRCLVAADSGDEFAYGMAAALGFATSENIEYYLTHGATEAIAVYRAVMAIVCHGSYGAIIGYYVGRAKRAPKVAGLLVTRGTLLAVVLHAAYDFPLLLFRRVKGAAPEYAWEVPLSRSLLWISLASSLGGAVLTVSLIRRSSRERLLPMHTDE